jgi:hypothetical protein
LARAPKPRFYLIGPGGGQLSAPRIRILTGIGIAAGVLTLISFVWMMLLIKSWELVLAPVYFIGIVIAHKIVGILVALLARTNLLYGLIGGVMAGISMILYKNATFAGNFSRDDMASLMIFLYALAFIALIIGTFGKRPLLWIYCGLVSITCLVSGIVSVREGLPITLVLTISGIA